MKKINNKILVILGPTASGKTKWAVQLVARFNGEIISADSRQVYRGLDVGTGKDLADYKFQNPNSKFQINSKIQNPKVFVPYHLIDVASPKTRFSLAEYQRLAYKAIDDILARGKLPIVVGGSGLYLQAIVDGYVLSAVKPDKELRKKLEVRSISELFKQLKKINPQMIKNLNNSDRNNKRRLIRYIEIAGDKIPLAKPAKKYNSLILGVTWPKEELVKRIYQRLIYRLEKEDMIGEVKRLKKSGLSWQRLIDFGLEYKYISLYLQKKITYEQMVDELFMAIKDFAKRQMTWFRRWERQGAKVYWVKNEKELLNYLDNQKFE